jgi:hypothetical protein
MGFAVGGANERPYSGSVRLRRTIEDKETAAGNLACFLVTHIFPMGMPDMVVAEHYMNPEASKSADATISQILCHGALYGLLKLHSIPWRQPYPSSVRKHFCGRSTALRPPPGGWKTDKEKRESSMATKQMVRARCIQLGYVKPECIDFDRCDAVAGWDFGVSTYARKAPQAFALYEPKIVRKERTLGS